MTAQPRERPLTEPDLSAFPAIQTLTEQTALASTRPFKGYSVLAVQHVQTSLVPLLDSLVLGGAEGAEITVVAKSYSTTEHALEALLDRGIHVVDPRRMNDQTQSYETEMAQRVADVLASHAQNRSLLILDEGGLAVRALRERGHRSGRVVAVEQTTRGIRAVTGTEPPFPVVDVARSAAKVNVEGPLIASSMLRGITTVARELALDLTASRIGLVGFGTVGRNLTALLMDAGLDLIVADASAHHLEQAAAVGAATAPVNEVLRTCDVILGCTGVGIVGSDQLGLLRTNAHLFNCASSDIEYRLWAFRRPEAVACGMETDAKVPWKCHFRLDRPGRILAAGGFAVNFYGPDEPISPLAFQITRALMLAGAIQAAGSVAGGVVQLDAELQRLAVEAYQKPT